MENSKRRSIHMQEKLRLSKSQGASTPAELKRMQNVPYALAVGLMNTKDMFLVYGGAVDWKSAKKSIFATSSAEAEYIAAFDASKEAVWVRKFISRLGVVPTIENPINMYCNNTGAIAIANESRITKGDIHFRAKVHYLREVIEFGDIKLEKVYTDDNLADPFTKALAFPKYSELTRNIVMLPASSLRTLEEELPHISPSLLQKNKKPDSVESGGSQDHGIIAHRTPPYTPQHNGVSERRNRTLLDMVRSMMSQTTLPKSLFG
ncbi:retrotransposon protein, putative, ty1-copia subclass [Tanacetum coccineum]